MKRLLSLLTCIMLATFVVQAGSAYDITVTDGKVYDDEANVITSAEEGQHIRVYADAVEGKYITGWTMTTSAGNSDVPEGYNGFTMPDEAITLTPKYADQTELIVDLSSGPVTDANVARNLYRAWVKITSTPKIGKYESGTFPASSMLIPPNPWNVDLDGDGSDDIKIYDAESISVLDDTNLSGTYSKETLTKGLYWPLTFKFPALEGIPIDEEHFPDDLLRQWLLAQTYGADAWLTTNEMNSVTELKLSNEYYGDHEYEGIKDLTGIEYFNNLERLVCYNLSLAELDVSVFPKLKYLDCSRNYEISTLDVTHNPELEELGCEDIDITSLDLSNNTKLKSLYCGKQMSGTALLNSLDLSNNPLLEELACYCQRNLDVSAIIKDLSELEALECSECNLNELDVSHNLKLNFLSAFHNNLTSLDVSQNLELSELWCEDNQLTTLDLSANTKMYNLYCDGNQITHLEVPYGQNVSIYDNQINIEEMEVLVNSLPTVESGELLVIDTEEGHNDGNIITKAQVQKAKDKGWKVLTSLEEDYEGIEAYPLWVGNTQVHEKNLDDILGDGGKAKFDPETNTLTLDNPTISKGYAGPQGDCMVYSELEKLIVNAPNGLKLSAGESDNYYGVYLNNKKSGELIINGDVSGDVSASALWTKGKVQLNGNIDIESSSKNHAIHAGEDIEIEGDVKAKMTGADSVQGVLDANNGNVKVVGNIDIESVSENGGYCVIYARKNIDVTGDVKIVKTGKGATPFYASNGSITVKGNLDITSSATGAVYASKNIDVTGDVKIISIGEGSTPFFAGDGSITVKGNLDITSSAAGAVCAYKNIDVIGNVKIVSKGKGATPFYASDGSITVKGNMDITSSAAGAIKAHEDVKIDGDVTITSLDSSYPYVIETSYGKVSVVSGRWTIDANGSTAIQAKGGIDIPETHKIWTPEGGKVATVDGYYVITKSDGTTKASNVVIDLRQEELTLSYSQTEVEATFGEEFTAPTLTIDPNEDAAFKTVYTYSTWTSSDESVATVDEDGKVTIVGAGTTTIKVSFPGDADFTAAEASYTLKVGLATPTLAFSETEVEATYGDVVVAPTLTTVPDGLTVVYSSSDESVATVDAATGEVTLLKSGEVTITATFEGNTNYEAAEATYTLTVLAAESSVELAEESLIAYIGEEIESPEATTTPEGLTLTWTSADESIATVDAATGTITPVDAGTTTITAAFEGNGQYLASEATYTLIVRHRIELLAPEFSLASGTEADPTPLAADEPLKVTFATEYLEENELTEDDVMVKLTVSLSGDVAGKDLPPASKTAHVVTSETFYLPLGESNFPEALKYGYTYDKITIESAELVINAEADDEEVVATCNDVPAELEWIGVQPLIFDGMIKQIVSHPQTGKQGEATGEQTVTITPAEDPGEVDITFSGFTMPVTGAVISEFTVTGVVMTDNEDGTISYNLPSYASNQVVIDRGTGDVKYAVALEGTQKSADALPVLKLTLDNSVIDTVWFGADEATINKAIVTGINETRSDARGTSDVYDLAGRRMGNVSRGINIVRTADGKTQKILKK